MSGFFAKLMFVIFFSSLTIDIKYGGLTWGTAVTGVIFVAAFVFWLRNNERLNLCKFCEHNKGEHRGYSVVGSRRYDGLCVNGYKTYGYEGIYGHCGCWQYTPRYKFWARKKR